ncbi:MAG: hypothetical protein PHP04_13280, partial [Bacteroidales bacterium]|nr:hypothetical protein [Bacteroidales bacterium]
HRGITGNDKSTGKKKLKSIMKLLSDGSGAGYPDFDNLITFGRAEYARKSSQNEIRRHPDQT